MALACLYYLIAFLCHFALVMVSVLAQSDCSSDQPSSG